QETGNWGARRSNFADAVDIVGWYHSKTADTYGVAKNDTYRLYMAYYLGWGNYKPGNWPANVQAYARSTDEMARRYAAQLRQCGACAPHCRLLLIRAPVRRTRPHIGIYCLPPITHLARFERLRRRPVAMRTIGLLATFLVTALLSPATRPGFVFLGLGPDLTRSGIAALPVRPLGRLARIAGTDAVRRIGGFGIMRLRSEEHTS